ncbi:MAG: VTT domain-containing protein [Acidobacteria bacterium]|nr:VTT domain-containing protein [Acidobacteriota bacterium]
MKSLQNLAGNLEHTLLLYGGWGLVGIAMLDSAGLSMPGVKDLLLIYLSSQDPGRAWIYVLGCVLGTVIGSFIIYAIGRTGARLLKRKPSDREMGRAKKWLVKNDFLTVVVASLLPPPLPFKPFLLGSGALRISPLRFAAALVIGGSLRFGAEAWIGVRYGVGGETFLKHNIIWFSLAFVAVVVVTAWIYRWYQGSGTKEKPAPPSAPVTSGRPKN